MAANYSQYTDHNEIGGVSVGLEDAKLAAADSVDEVTSTDCVLMKDASGNPVKILKEDFNDAVRDALGIILSNTPLGTSIGKVAALGSSDNDLGSISTSDLASVLGVNTAFPKRGDAPLDADDAKNYGMYFKDAGTNYTNYPTGGYAALYVINGYEGQETIQLFKETVGSSLFIRSSNTTGVFTSWKKILPE